MESVSALSAGAYTVTLYLMVAKVKGGGRSPPTLTSQGLPLYIYSVMATGRVFEKILSDKPVLLRLSLVRNLV
jgi:hypothetical protein